MYVHFFFSGFYKMSSDEDVTLILLLVMGGVSALATLAGGFFATRETQCQAAFTPWTTCTDECDTEPTRSRKYVIQSGAEACPYIDGYTETESCGPVQPCCEVEEDWAPEGTCSTTGLQKITRKLKANKPGGCDGITTEEFYACCYEEGDWDFDGACGEYETGMQRSIQTTAGCTPDKEYKDEPCAPCQGDWSNEIPESCPGPNECGFGAKTFSKTWNVTVPAIGTGTCPNVETLVCDVPTPPCPCPGTWPPDFPPCPTECGQPQTTVYRYWEPGTKDGGKNYESCPTSQSKTCPATPSCCVRTPWTPSGGCTPQGQKQVRTVTGSDCGEEDIATSQFLPCCGYTAWTPSGKCTPDGQKQEREEIENTDGPTCAKEEEQSIERNVPCCGYTEWTPSGQCTPDGQKQKRDVDTTVQGCAPEETEETTEQFMPCCGYTEWTPSGQCTKTPDGTDATLAKIRSVIESTDENPCAPEENPAFLTGADPCCAMDEGWSPVGVCTDGVQQYTKNPVGTTCQEGDGVKTEECAPCEGDWGPVCPSGCGYEGGSLEQTWVTTEPAVDTGTCPSGTRTTQCPATGACPSGMPLGVIVGGAAAGVAGAAGVFCTIYPEKCLESQPATGEDAQELLDEVDVNCIGYWDKYVEGFPECLSCGTDNVTYTATYKHYIKQTGAGAHCEYHDGYTRTKTCPATNPCSCPGKWDKVCPKKCGTPATTIQRTWNTNTPTNPFLAYDCPPSENVSCPQTLPCCTYNAWEPPLVTGEGACIEGQIDVSRSKSSNEPCLDNPSVDNRLTKKVSCQNCVGYWSENFPSCPTECGFGGGNVYKEWTTVIGQDANGYGKECPSTADRPSKYCPATSRCPCPGYWNAYPPCPTECGQPESTVTRTWAEGEKDPSKFYSSCPWPSSRTCPATSKCVTPDGTYFSYPADDYYARLAIGAKALPGQWLMATGYHEIGGNGPWYYSFTLPELIYIAGIGYEAHNRSDVLPSSFEWYTINPNGSWSGPVTMSEITSTKANNYGIASFRASKGYRGTLSKGLVFKINSYVLNPNDPTSGDDLDFRLNFGITGNYAGQFAT